MTYGHSLWENTIAFAEKCSWRAGAFLAGKMRDNEFTDIERVLVAHKGEEIAAFCTFSEKDELPDDSEYTPFIGFVFVDENYRGQRISEKMIDEACKPCAGNIADDESAGHAQHISKPAGPSGKDGQPYGSQKYIDQLADRAHRAAQQNT